MRRGITIVAGVALPLMGCRPTPTAPAEAPDATSPSGETLIEPRRSVEVALLSIPLFDGGAVELARFRGTVVLLEVSASYAQGWDDLHQHYARALDAHGEDTLSVITVSLDMEPDALTRWERDPPPFTLGWDPQGALAARLGVTQMPTVFVLDAEGQLVEEMRGWSDDLQTRIDRTLDALLQATPSS